MDKNKIQADAISRLGKIWTGIENLNRPKKQIALRKKIERGAKKCIK